MRISVCLREGCPLVGYFLLLTCLRIIRAATLRTNYYGIGIQQEYYKHYKSGPSERLFPVELGQWY
jgi:hypothetical protein